MIRPRHSLPKSAGTAGAAPRPADGTKDWVIVFSPSRKTHGRLPAVCRSPAPLDRSGFVQRTKDRLAFSTCSIVGMEGAAPLTETAREEAIDAFFSAEAGVSPFVIQVRK